MMVVKTHAGKRQCFNKISNEVQYTIKAGFDGVTAIS